MKIIPGYAVVDTNDRIIGAENDIEKVKELVKGTNNRIFDVNKSEYITKE